jgi:hypothetical protein
MSGFLGIISVWIGTVLGLVLCAVVVFWFVQDVTQKKHAVLRNYPVIGRLRYLFEKQGEYFRQYFFAGDRDEMPFNRATRAWVYRVAKKEDGAGLIGFGSTYDIKSPGAILFVNAPFPVQEWEKKATPPLTIGEGWCVHPFTARSIVNISGMSFGAISKPAVRALSRGAAEAGCWMDTGEGGLAPYHLEGGCDVIMQIGTAKYGIRDADGNFSPERAKELGKVVKAFEIKLSQGAKPGKGGVLPGGKVTAEIAAIRGIPQGQDSISPNRHRDAGNTTELLDQVAYLRTLTGRPVGIKTAIGGWWFLERHRRERAPPRARVRARFHRDRRRRGRQRRSSAGALRPHEPVDRGGPAARGRRALRIGAEGSHPARRIRKARDLGARSMGALRRRGLHQYGTRLHVFAGLHPGAALPYQHVPLRVSRRTMRGCSVGSWSRRNSSASRTMRRA